MTDFEWVSLLIFLPGLAFFGLFLFRKLSKTNTEHRTIYKYSIKKKDILAVKVALSIFFGILLYELFKFAFTDQFRFFTTLFLIHILYDLYLTLKFHKFDSDKTFIYYSQEELYDYIAPEKTHVFKRNDIEKTVVYDIAHPTGEFKVADIYLLSGKVRITVVLLTLIKFHYWS